MRIEPITDRSQIARAVQQAAGDVSAQWYVTRMARALGAEDELPGEWQSEAEAISSFREYTDEEQAQIDRATELTDSALRSTEDLITGELEADEVLSLAASVANMAVRDGIGSVFMEGFERGLAEFVTDDRLHQDDADALIASARKVASPDGAKRYNLPIGTPLDGSHAAKAAAKPVAKIPTPENVDNVPKPKSTLAEIKLDFADAPRDDEDSFHNNVDSIVGKYGLKSERVFGENPGGHPVYRLQGSKEGVKKYLDTYNGGDGSDFHEFIKEIDNDDDAHLIAADKTKVKARAKDMTLEDAEKIVAKREEYQQEMNKAARVDGKDVDKWRRKKKALENSVDFNAALDVGMEARKAKATAPAPVQEKAVEDSEDGLPEDAPYRLKTAKSVFSGDVVSRDDNADYSDEDFEDSADWMQVTEVDGNRITGTTMHSGYKSTWELGPNEKVAVHENPENFSADDHWSDEDEDGMYASGAPLPEGVALVAGIRRIRTDAGVKRFGAPKGTPIVRDPETGELVAQKSVAKLGGDKLSSPKLGGQKLSSTPIGQKKVAEPIRLPAEDAAKKATENIGKAQGGKTSDEIRAQAKERLAKLKDETPGVKSDAPKKPADPFTDKKGNEQPKPKGDEPKAHDPFTEKKGQEYPKPDEDAERKAAARAKFEASKKGDEKKENVKLGLSQAELDKLSDSDLADMRKTANESISSKNTNLAGSDIGKHILKTALDVEREIQKREAGKVKEDGKPTEDDAFDKLLSGMSALDLVKTADRYRLKNDDASKAKLAKVKAAMDKHETGKKKIDGPQYSKSPGNALAAAKAERVAKMKGTEYEVKSTDHPEIEAQKHTAFLAKLRSEHNWTIPGDKAKGEKIAATEKAKLDRMLKNKKYSGSSPTSEPVMKSGAKDEGKHHSYEISPSRIDPSRRKVNIRDKDGHTVHTRTFDSYASAKVHARNELVAQDTAVDRKLATKAEPNNESNITKSVPKPAESKDAGLQTLGGKKLDSDVSASRARGVEADRKAAAEELKNAPKPTTPAERGRIADLKDKAQTTKERADNLETYHYSKTSINTPKRIDDAIRDLEYDNLMTKDAATKMGNREMINRLKARKEALESSKKPADPFTDKKGTSYPKPTGDEPKAFDPFKGEKDPSKPAQASAPTPKLGDTPPKFWAQDMQRSADSYKAVMNNPKSTALDKRAAEVGVSIMVDAAKKWGTPTPDLGDYDHAAVKKRTADDPINAPLKARAAAKAATTPASKPTFVAGKSASLGKVNLNAKGKDPERFQPKTTFADGEKPAKGAKVRDSSGRTGIVTETYQTHTAVKWDDGATKTVKNDKLNTTDGGATARRDENAAKDQAWSAKQPLHNSPEAKVKLDNLNNAISDLISKRTSHQSFNSDLTSAEKAKLTRLGKERTALVTKMRESKEAEAESSTTKAAPATPAAVPTATPAAKAAPASSLAKSSSDTLIKAASDKELDDYIKQFEPIANSGNAEAKNFIAAARKAKKDRLIAKVQGTAPKATSWNIGAGPSKNAPAASAPDATSGAAAVARRKQVLTHQKIEKDLKAAQGDERRAVDTLADLKHQGVTGDRLKKAQANLKAARATRIETGKSFVASRKELKSGKA